MGSLPRKLFSLPPGLPLTLEPKLDLLLPRPPPPPPNSDERELSVSQYDGSRLPPFVLYMPVGAGGDPGAGGRIQGLKQF